MGGTPVPKSFKSMKMGILLKFWVQCDVASNLTSLKGWKFSYLALFMWLLLAVTL